MEDQGTNRGSFLDRARSAIENVQQDERVKQAAAAAGEAAEQTREASKNFSRKVTQQDSWEELRGDVEELTEIVRAHQALIVDLLDRMEALEARRGA
jgi:ATP-dependent exoDNAse (exonuclease V) alpha subunit